MQIIKEARSRCPQKPKYGERAKVLAAKLVAKGTTVSELSRITKLSQSYLHRTMHRGFEDTGTPPVKLVTVVSSTPSPESENSLLLSLETADYKVSVYAAGGKQ